MKKLSLLVAVSTFSMIVFASPASHAPRVYLMMKKGRLIEVNHGRRRIVKKDVVLANLTTVHPNGAIDASSGQNIQLKADEYITMDGRIRKLKDMAR
jgi:hypothetical protein